MSGYFRFNVGGHGRHGNVNVHGDNRGNYGIHVRDHENGIYADFDRHGGRGGYGGYGGYGGHYGGRHGGYDYSQNHYDPQREAIRQEIWRGRELQEEETYRNREKALDALERSNSLKEFKLDWQNAGGRAGVDFVYWNNEKWADWNHQWRAAEKEFVRGNIDGAYAMLDSYYEKNVGPRGPGQQPSQQQPQQQPQVDEQRSEAQKFFAEEVSKLEKSWNFDNIPKEDRPVEKGRLFRNEQNLISALVNEGRYDEAEKELNKAWDRYDQYADLKERQQSQQKQAPSGPTTPEAKPGQPAPEPKLESYVQYIPISKESIEQAWKGEKPEREDFETRADYKAAKKDWKHERDESRHQFSQGDAKGAVETLEGYRERTEALRDQFKASQRQVHQLQALAIAWDPSLQDQLGNFVDCHTGHANGCDGVPGPRTLDVQHKLQEHFGRPITNTHDPQLIADITADLARRAQKDLAAARGEHSSDTADAGTPTAGVNQQRGQTTETGRA